jgi:restriction system-associated AAA family ATPase
MKLKYIKLLSPFRSLPEGFEITFRQQEETGKALQPLCLVGLNGSGKSNVLQVISEIFYYLELYSISPRADRERMKTPFGFRIEYWPGSRLVNDAGLDLILNDITPNMLVNYIYFEKQKDELPELYLVPAISTSSTEGLKVHRIPDKELYPKELVSTDFTKVLPKNIVGYSSGMNELISNAFIKIDFHYFGFFKQSIRRQEYGISNDINRLFFMDYDSNKMVILCNYLFWEKRRSTTSSQQQVEEKEVKFGILNKEMAIENIESFSITIRFAGENNTLVQFTSYQLLIMERLKKCATTLHDNAAELKAEEHYKREIKLHFWVDDATRKAFRWHFKTPLFLYRDLHVLQLMNIHLFGQPLQETVRRAGPGTNLSSLIPKPAQSSLVFSIDDISLIKRNVKDPVFYRQLSDGEHQLLHVLGTIMLIDTSSSVFIMDEPETHLNPEWRSKFVSLLNEIVASEEVQREQEIVLTSHSPFIVSDCQPDHVFKFSRNSVTREIQPITHPDFVTFGASVNMITAKVFGKKETIAGLANDQLKAVRTEVQSGAKSKEQAMEEINRLGDSVEKIMLLDELSKM